MTTKQFLVLERKHLKEGASVILLSRQGHLLQVLLPLNHSWMPDMIVRVKGMRLKFGWKALWGHHLAKVTEKLSNMLERDTAKHWRQAYARKALTES